MTTSTDSGRPERYWRKNLRLIGILLAIWGIVTFIPAYFASELADVTLFGWPFPFWVAAFGGPTAFLMIVGVYAWRMEYLDRQLRAERIVDQDRSQI
ncbi:DUF4212 domain-containing protein [Zwartia sp.]|uniref:DUF4212 domain-containing protein n=1 Tax=Zwartia sp. TaxID=2978004 RepID=UPI00271BC302|nr:DUF4212 domain-containing protein [Zwartia sp.]MDO9023826.1 DUF4212 domain-containing protein [Zwartia sp.]